MAESGRISRLRWLCRRGMKELDILLERFVDENQSSLQDGAWPELESLLSAEDDDLWDWFQDPSRASPRPYRELLETIRDARL